MSDKITTSRGVADALSEAGDALSRVEFALRNDVFTDVHEEDFAHELSQIRERLARMARFFAAEAGEGDTE